MRIENIKLDDLEIKGVYTPAKRIDCGDYYMIYVSGIQAPMNENKRVITDDIGEQTKLVFEDINNILREAGASLDNVIKAVIYLTDMNDFEVVSQVRAEYFKNSMPTSTMVEVNRLTRDGAKIEIEVTALLEK